MPTWGAQHRGRWEGRTHCVPPDAVGVCDAWVSALFSQGPFLALMSPRRIWGSGPCPQQQADQWRFTFHSGEEWQEKKLTEDNAQSQDEASRESGGECAALALLLAWDCGRDRERQCWSGLLSSGEVVMEGDQGVESREPTPCSGPLAALMLFLICRPVTRSLV